MQCRLIAILAILCFAFGGGGCASKSNKDYEEILMPLQTGSVLQRRVLVKKEMETKPTKKKKKKPSSPTPKPEAEPAVTPAPEEESTPAPEPERFR
jgi:hypothetical protein